MEALYIRPSVEDGVVAEGEELERSGGQEEGGMEASSPTGSTTDEDTDEDSEAEPPSVVCRKVSFADAFGLNLVSVKEFDNVEATVSEVSRPPEREAAFPQEEFYMSCLFTVPSSPEELAQRLQAQMVELESIELLPGTSVLRGIVRVVNLGYSKSVHARISLDCWSTYFDLFAEYVPGSSDRETDRFAFKYTLIPPFDREGTRVDFCLRYETTAGTFWANNNELNYVLFCHQRGQAKDPGPQVLEESSRSKRSCLKANRRGGAEEKTKESNGTAALSAGAHDRQTADSTDAPLPLPHAGHQPSVDGIKSWHGRACLTRGQDHPSQRREAPRVYSHDSAAGHKISPPAPAPWCDPVSSRYNRQRKPSDGPRILTYHQIPLLRLDWKSDTPQQWGAADMDDIWAGNGELTRPKASEENAEDTASVNDLWERFLNSTDAAGDEDTSVCDVWQQFLNQPSRRDHAGVPEAEWLQTAALVSPSSHRDSSSHASAAASSGFDRRALAEATPDASQRSQTNPVTHTPQEFGLEGARPASGGCVDSSAPCHMLANGERAGKRGDERVTLHAADLVTSSGETKTADTGETPQSLNASAGDSISQRAGLDGGLSSTGEGEVRGAAHNTASDTLAFGETEDGERFVFFTSTERAGEGRIVANCTGNRASTEETIFRPQETEACEKHSEEFGLNPESGNPLMEKGRDENETSPSLHEGNEEERNESEMTEGKEGSSSSGINVEVTALQRSPAERHILGSSQDVTRGRGEEENTRLRDEDEKVENPPHVECRKSSVGTKAEGTVPLEARVGGAFVERFGEDLVRGIWEEVFGRGAWDMNMKGSPADITRDRPPLLLSLIEPSLRIHQDPETSGAEPSPEGSRQSINQTHSTDLDWSAHPARELTIGSAKEPEHAPQIRNRQRQETAGQYHKHATFPPDKFKESGDLLRWSLHVLRHLTRLLLCTLLVAGFFTILFIYDFPAFIALYVFSGCWWLYKWTRHQVGMDKRARGEFKETSEGAEECGV